MLVFHLHDIHHNNKLEIENTNVSALVKLVKEEFHHDVSIFWNKKNISFLRHVEDVLISFQMFVVI